MKIMRDEGARPVGGGGGPKEATARLAPAVVAAAAALCLSFSPRPLPGAASDGAIEVIWQKVRSRADLCYGQEVAVGPDDSIYFAGTDWPEGGQFRMVLGRRTSEGALLWDKTLSTGPFTQGLAVDPAGNAYVVTAGSIHKFSPAGEPLWVVDTSEYPARSGLLSLWGIAAGSDALYVCGMEGLDNVDGVGALFKYDFGGNLLWRRVFGYMVQTCIHSYVDLALDANGNPVVGASEKIDGTSYRMSLAAKFDPAGNQQWLRRIEGTGFMDIAIDGEDHAIAAVRGRVFKWSPSGELVWETPIVPVGIAAEGEESLICGPDGSVYVASQWYVDDVRRAGLARFDRDGRQTWSGLLPLPTLHKPWYGKTKPGCLAIDFRGCLILIESIVGAQSDSDLALLKFRFRDVAPPSVETRQVVLRGRVDGEEFRIDGRAVSLDSEGRFAETLDLPGAERTVLLEAIKGGVSVEKRVVLRK